MKNKYQKRSEALQRLELNIAERTKLLHAAGDDEELVKFLKTKLNNLNRDAANLRKKLERY